jgi:hypothetical protein
LPFGGGAIQPEQKQGCGRKCRKLHSPGA